MYNNMITCGDTIITINAAPFSLGFIFSEILKQFSKKRFLFIFSDDVIFTANKSCL